MWRGQDDKKEPGTPQDDPGRKNTKTLRNVVVLDIESLIYINLVPERLAGQDGWKNSGLGSFFVLGASWAGRFVWVFKQPGVRGALGRAQGVHRKHTGLVKAASGLPGNTRWDDRALAWCVVGCLGIDIWQGQQQDKPTLKHVSSTRALLGNSVLNNGDGVRCSGGRLGADRTCILRICPARWKLGVWGACVKLGLQDCATG